MKVNFYNIIIGKICFKHNIKKILKTQIHKFIDLVFNLARLGVERKSKIMVLS